MIVPNGYTESVIQEKAGFAFPFTPAELSVAILDGSTNLCKKTFIFFFKKIPVLQSGGAEVGGWWWSRRCEQKAWDICGRQESGHPSLFLSSTKQHLIFNSFL